MAGAGGAGGGSDGGRGNTMAGLLDAAVVPVPAVAAPADDAGYAGYADPGGRLVRCRISPHIFSPDTRGGTNTPRQTSCWAFPRQVFSYVR